MHPLPLASHLSLTAALARVLADRARPVVEARGLGMFVAIVDAAGVPLVVERINHAQPASFEVALAKARAAVGFRRATKVFEDRILANGRVNLLSLPGIIAVEGGVPIIGDAAVVGAVGVSGGTGVEDGEIAAVVVAAFEEISGRAGQQ